MDKKTTLASVFRLNSRQSNVRNRKGSKNSAIVRAVIIGTICVAFYCYSGIGINRSDKLDFNNFSMDLYSTCQRKGAQTDVLPMLSRSFNCKSLFKEVVQSKANVQWPPPETVPSKLYAAYTMNGKIPIVDYYLAERQNQAPKPYEWNKDFMSSYINQARNRLPMVYLNDTYGLYFALETFPVKNMNGIVIGSQSPWVEAICLVNGASVVTTIEYHEIISTVPAIKYMHPNDVAAKWLSGKLPGYDFAISFSSLEHSGLGRYGDPINPYADLDEVARIGCLLRPNALLYLTVPLGLDRLVWNAHRIYGRERLPLLIANWELLNVFYIEGEVKDMNSLLNYGVVTEAASNKQAVMVLKNLRNTPCQ